MDCSPCFRKACDTLECMKSISIEEVFEAVKGKAESRRGPR
jgi:ADP-heptose:LPS heptosyltransferase